MSVKLSCRKVSMTITSLSMHRSFMYLPFLVKTCSSEMQLTVNSDGNTLCTSQMSTFLSLPVGSENSHCLVPINLMILKYCMYFASKFDFLLKFLIIIKSFILYCGVSSYLSLFCLELASFVLSAANIHVCLSLLSFGCRKASRWGRYGLHLKKKVEGFLGVLIG